MSYLFSTHFHDEERAYEYFEARLWPDGPVCPHCSGSERIGKLKGNSTRAGLWKCYHCRKPFTVRIDTVLEGSKVPMRKWLQAMYLIAGSKKGISSNQLHRILGVTRKTAWFMSHRIREAMQGDVGSTPGEPGQQVEAEETFTDIVPCRSVKRSKTDVHHYWQKNDLHHHLAELRLHHSGRAAPGDNEIIRAGAILKDAAGPRYAHEANGQTS